MNYDINFNEPILANGECFSILVSGVGYNQSFTHCSNDPLTLDLEIGNYTLTIKVISEARECPETIINFTIYPPPEEPPIEPPVDPPPTAPIPCNCITIDGLSVDVGCNGLTYLNGQLIFPANNTPCSYRVWVKYGNNSASMYSYNISQNSFTIPLTQSNNVYVRIQMYCCQDGTYTYCNDWTLIDVNDCSCDAPDISLINKSNLTANTTQMLIEIEDTSAGYPPYLVTFISGTNTFTQTFSGYGQYTIIIPFAFTLGVLSVSNVCGSNSINVTNSYCKNAPFIDSLERDLISNPKTLTVQWYADALSDCDLKVFIKGQLIHNVTVTPLVGVLNTYTWSLTNSQANASDILVVVSDICGSDDKTNYL